MKSLEKKRVFGLDLLRAIAISLVVVSHATYILFPNSEHSIVTLIRIFGAIGVDLFFVLSGFLIGRILLKTLLKSKVSFTDLTLFWKRRWLRTLPNYVLILCVNIVLCLSLGQALPENIMYYFVFLQNFSLDHPDFFTEAWSLSIEEFAYIVLPFLLFISVSFWQKIDKAKLFLWGTILTIIVLFVFKINYYFNTEVVTYKDWSGSYRKVVIYRLDAIYISFLLVYIMQVIPEFIKQFKVVFALLGVFILTLLHILIYWFQLLPQTHLWFYVFVYLNGLIIGLALILPYFSVLDYSGIGKNCVEFISKTSYSIYLINYSIVLLTLKYFFDFQSISLFSRIGVLLIFLMVTLIASILVYRCFESPILDYRNKHFKS
jgi:peptidoglycan/LPS O-acetylase OafA/YrhL